jgi:predicted NUDIX family NTP pyrophosphohydrolase
VKTSAGIVLYRWKGPELQVLLGHMGGPFWEKRDEGAWSIPKGLVEEGEDPLTTARREFQEEMGSLPEGDLIELPEIRQKSGKRVKAWALEGELDPAMHESNLFSLEWPPKSGNIQQFPELDQVEWMSMDKACSKAVEGQAELFRALERILQGNSG